MTQAQEIRPSIRQFAAKLSGFIAFLYGLASYAIFFVTFLYAIGFVSGVVVPKTIDTGPAGPAVEALIVNVLLMSLLRGIVWLLCRWCAKRRAS